MTWEEAKDQIAKKAGRKSWYTLLCLTLEPSELGKLIDEAADLYAREKADKAYDAGIDNYWSNHPDDKKEFMRQLFPEK